MELNIHGVRSFAVNYIKSDVIPYTSLAITIRCHDFNNRPIERETLIRFFSDDPQTQDLLHDIFLACANTIEAAEWQRDELAKAEAERHEGDIIDFAYDQYKGDSE